MVPLDKQTLYFSSRPSSTIVRRKSFIFGLSCKMMLDKVTIWVHKSDLDCIEEFG